MSEIRLLTVKCQCGVTLQVKTHATEKMVACPKCRASIQVSVPVATASLPPLAMTPPLATLAPPLAMTPPLATLAPPLAMAPPLATLAPPLATSRPWSPKHVAVAGGIGGSLLVAAVMLIAFRAGSGSPNQPSSGTTGSMVQPGTTPETVEVTELAEETPSINEQAAAGPTEGEQGGSFFDSLSKARINQGANNPGIGFPQGGGFPSVGNTQQRDWDLANGGRLGAMGLKKVKVPRR